jgi:hypothetical protein
LTLASDDCTVPFERELAKVIWIERRPSGFRI